LVSAAVICYGKSRFDIDVTSSEFIYYFLFVQ
jgi:hypothetical protein